MDEDYVEAGYAWEAEYKRSWDEIQENETGLVIKAAVKKKRRQTLKIQRGILRQLVILIDASHCMSEKDLAPNRLDFVFSHLKHFLEEFFDQNPLSHILIVGMRDGLAEKWSNWSGNPSILNEMLQKQRNSSGDASLQNGLDLAHENLRHGSGHVSKEILVIFGSLSSTDPGNIFDSIDSLAQDNIRISCIGLSAGVHICQTMCKKTNGNYNVILNETHFKDILFEHIQPSPLLSLKAKLIEMGFPNSVTREKPSWCACHFKSILLGYVCPRCKATVCSIPADCPVCSLVLVSSPSLARTYPFLFPIPNFIESGSATCIGCLEMSKVTWKCGKCANPFCSECDLYIHESLHVCPGCV